MTALQDSMTALQGSMTALQGSMTALRWSALAIRCSSALPLHRATPPACLQPACANHPIMPSVHRVAPASRLLPTSHACLASSVFHSAASVLQISSRFTHDAVRQRDRVYVANTGEGKVLELAFPSMQLVRALLNGVERLRG